MKTYRIRRSVVAFIAGTASALALLGVTPARSDAAILFQDNFESPLFTSGGDNDPDNGGLAGNWDNFQESAPSLIQVTTGTSPAPFEGKQHLAVNTAGTNTWVGGTLSAPINTGSFYTTFRTYVTGTGAFVTAFSFTSNAAPFDGSPANESTNSSDVVLAIFHDAATGTLGWRSGTRSIATTGVAYSSAVWQSIKIEFFFGGGTGGSDAFRVTVGNTSSALIDYSGLLNGAATGTTIRRFNIAGVTAQVYFVDQLLIAIPEPASAAMLALGAVMLMRRQRG